MSFFGLEQPIVSHLAATCVSIGFIAGIGDAQSIGWNANFVQEKSVGAGKYGAAFVFAHPDFLSLQSETAQGACQFNKQRWVIAVCSRDQRGVETAHKGLANNVRQSNGPLVIEVLDAMRTLRWTAINDKREGMRELRRVDIGGTLPGIVVNNNGLYITLLCFEADLTGSFGSSAQPGQAYAATPMVGPPGPPLPRTSSAAPAGLAQLPNDGDMSMHKNTTSGALHLCVNDGGLIKSVALI